MPKIIDKKKREEIVAFAKRVKNQHEAARKYGVSFMYVNAAVNNRPIKRTRSVGGRCPITGLKY